MKHQLIFKQRGVSLIGVIFWLLIAGFFFLIAVKVVPTVTEYMAIKKAIVVAKAAGATPREIQLSFDKQADATYIDSIKGTDLTIDKSDTGGFEVSFAYPKKIELFGPVSLLIDYAGSTAPKALGGPKKNLPE